MRKYNHYSMFLNYLLIRMIYIKRTVHCKTSQDELEIIGLQNNEFKLYKNKKKE